MKQYRIPLAFALFAVPLLLRTVWFYQGFFWRTEEVATPDYAAFAVPQPPVSTPEPATDPVRGTPGAVILLDQSHDNLFIPSEIVSLTDLLRDRGARVETVSGGYASGGLADSLKYASAYITICPHDAFSLPEAQLLQRFRENGGRLLVLTDPTRSVSSYEYGSATLASDVDFANTLLAAFDIAVLDDYLYNMTEYEGNFRNVLFEEFADADVTDGVGKVVLYAAHSLQSTSGSLLLIGADNTLSSLTDTGGGHAAGALDASGQVLALGDLTFLAPPYNTVADNPLLISRLADFLLEAERSYTLADYPYLFQRPVSIVPLKDIDLTADLLGPIRTLQEDLMEAGIDSTLSPVPRDGEDLLLLGSYGSEGLEEYLLPLGITLPFSYGSGGTGSRIEIPELGSIKPNGTGLVLFVQEESRITLLILSEDPDSLTDLMDLVTPSGFSTCLLQEKIAVCRTGSSSGGLDDFWWDFSEEEELDLFDATPTPEPMG